MLSVKKGISGEKTGEENDPEAREGGGGGGGDDCGFYGYSMLPS